MTVLFALPLLLGLVAPQGGSEVVLSSAVVTLERKRMAQVVLKLEGAKRITWMGNDAHEGRLVAVVKPGGKPWVESDLSGLIDRPSMTFLDDSWDISFADYNHDGRLDFNVGEQCGSNNFCYWLFTIEASGRVVRLELPHAGNRPGFLWLGDDSHSTRLISLTADGISYSGYDPLNGGFGIRLRWDHEAQTFVRTPEPSNSGSGDKQHAP